MVGNSGSNKIFNVTDSITTINFQVHHEFSWSHTTSNFLGYKLPQFFFIALLVRFSIS